MGGVFMELPKNITRVGQADSHCKIYVEDYVMTYMKQMNTLARDREMAIALYGVRREEESVSYIFIYGAGRMNSLQREVRHLSQAQNQEIEKIRKQHFSDYRFIGYRLLNGDMIDGMHICEQGICRYVEGYAQFYEKNDLMLAYMLASRKNDAEPEKVNREKYDVVERKRETVRREFQQSRNRNNVEKVSGNALFGQMKVAVVLAFALLCMMGVATVKGSGDSNALQAMSDKIVDKLAEDKILTDEKMLETDEATQQSQKLQKGDVVESSEMIQQGDAAQPSEIVQQGDVVETSETIQQGDVVQPSEIVQQGDVVETSEMIQQGDVVQPSEITQQEETTQDTQVVQQEVVAQPTVYTIAQGDNLIAISVKIYGDDSMVDAICELNQIDNADDIKIGQKILLP